MAIISFDKDALVDYVPAFGGNRDSDNPCIIKLKFVPYKRIQYYSRLIAARTKNLMDSGKITESSQEILKKQFTENVESVSGYFVGAREVADPGEFYDTADTDLVIEIMKAMESISKLTEGQRKNL